MNYDKKEKENGKAINMTTHAKNKLDGFYIGETVYTGPNSTHKVTIEKFMIVCNGNGRYTNFAMTDNGWWPIKQLVKIKK